MAYAFIRARPLWLDLFRMRKDRGLTDREGRCCSQMEAGRKTSPARSPHRI